MSLIIALIIGGIVGWLGAALTGRDEGIVGSIAIGVIGSIIGGAVANVLGANHGFLALSWSGIFWSLVGAIILSAPLNVAQHRTHHTV